MNRKYLLLLLVVLVSMFASCKKLNQSPLTGTWQETKLRMYEQDGSGTILYDTTYLHPFTSFDYIEFYSNATVKSSADYYYFLNSPGLPKVPQQTPPQSSITSYLAVGSEYVLDEQPQLVNPGGFDVADTVSILSSNTLLLHSVFYPHQPGLKIISDSYYTK